MYNIISNNMVAKFCKLLTLVLFIVTIFDLKCIESTPYRRSSYEEVWRYNRATLPPSCSSQIYCQGKLLHDVSVAHIFPDSKSFVDKKLKYKESEILAKYDTLLNATPNPDSKTLANFVAENFEDGNELEVWSPPDFTTTPSLYYRVSNEGYRRWVLDLNSIWKELGRKVKEEVKEYPELYSLIYTPNGFFIPGGRFTELYYWDTYWIVQGVLLCDMKQTAKGVIENIISIVDKFGLMPNGARVYYLERSQPPLLIPMAATYVKYTGDFTFIKTHIQTLTNEFEYWMRTQITTVEKNGKYYKMARYYAPSTGPRPESYREDYELAEGLSDEEKEQLYIELKSGAESGWDFSSKWFITKNGDDQGTLKDIKASKIIPVELNAILEQNARYLSEWWLKLGDREQSNKYKTIAYEFLQALQNVCWDDEAGSWFDYDILNNKPRPYFYGSNLVPLWTNSYNMDRSYVAQKILKYLRANHVIDEDNTVKFYGTPTSMQNTSQQWDYPNGWAPIQAYIIQGLDNIRDKNTQLVAYRLAQNWVKTNYEGYEKHKVMYEKYDVEILGETGGGGEYVPQSGFGWTNGFIFEMLNRYGKIISPDGVDGDTHHEWKHITDADSYKFDHYFGK